MINFKQEIDNCFDDLVVDMENLVSVNSVLDLTTAAKNQPFGKANREVLDKMLTIGTRDGFITKDVDGYAGHIDIGSGQEVVAVLGHLDVVPVNETGWDTPPFTLTKVGNKYFGRGTSDDKGPLLAAYYAAKILENSDLELRKKIRIIFGCNEETGSKCMKYYFTKEPFPDMGFTPDANFPVVYGEKKGVSFTIEGDIKEDCLISLHAGTVVNIVPEKAVATLKGTFYQESFEVFLKEKRLTGKCTISNDQTTLELIGKSSHASLPHLGKNAVVLLCEYIATETTSSVAKFIDQYFRDDYHAKKLGFGFTGQMGDLTCSLGILHFENNAFKMMLDLRCPHELDEEHMLSCMKNVLAPLNLTETHHIGRHLYVDPDSKLIQSLHAAYVDCTGDTKAIPQAIGGGTYAKTMPNCVAFGPELPGKDNQIHQNNEFTEIDELKLAIQIYANALYNLTK